MPSKQRFASLALTALKSNLTRLDRPFKLNFSVTYNCQSRCLTCSIWEIRPKGELTIDEIKEFARKNNYFKWITITGGEPFLRSDIVEIARAFKENCNGLYLMTMPTNSLCNPSTVEARLRQILALGIPRVAITLSLDGYRELHDKIRGVPGNFDKVMENCKMIKRLQKEYSNLSFVFGYTMSKFNQGQFEKTFQAVKAIFPDVTYNDFHINLAQVSENYYQNGALDIRPDGAAAAAELSGILEKRKPSLDPMMVIESAFLKKLIVFARTGRSPMKCRSLEASAFMDGWGNIYPSIMWNKKVGNIRESDYDLISILNSQAANEVRKDIQEDREPAEWTSCEAYQILTGSLMNLI
ncbi:MAG: radical SAM protein [Candidatus Marsarchaeota archaeon]|nr:radical SAM protein [Candidatus Marsarchaeota archaeon]MCL5114918.1 radical SAM protein [Candidatus Marsarchaeota archaeon]